MKALNAGLEDRVAARTAELNIMNAEPATEILQRQATESTLSLSEERLRTIANNLPILISCLNRETQYLFANAEYGKWFGISAGNMIGRSIEQVFGAAFYKMCKPYALRCLKGETVRFDTEIQVDGESRILESLYIPQRSKDEVTGFYILSMDVTAARSEAKDLQLLARSDTLTGLPNRRHYEEKLNETALRCGRTGKLMTLMFLNVDLFKQINDTLAHAAGDAVLRELARRFKTATRETDTVSRLAGDEFAIILEGITHSSEAELVAKKILAAMEQPIDIAGHGHTVAVSIGIVCLSGRKLDPALLRIVEDRARYGSAFGVQS